METQKVLLNRTIIRSKFAENNVYLDAIDLINYLATESDIGKVKTRLVKIQNQVAESYGIKIDIKN